MSEMEHGGHHPSQSSWALLLGSIGVVYGDIGTSPLYAFRETLVQAKSDGLLTAQEVYGVLSLILWALLFIVTIKYVLILLRADNNGEGGTLSLMALARKATGHSTFIIFALGVVGASLFYGDAIITPAISVMSAVEGLKLVTPTFEPYVLPITVLVLVGLFAVQSRGTAKVAKFFGPVMVVWFFAIGAAGLIHIFDDPDVLLSFNPYYAFDYLAHHGEGALLALGAVFLAVTGAEALYADLGHFGRKPIQRAWIWLVLPCLALNYLGQGALVLAHPETVENPFFLMMPSWALLPMVLLAGMATIIASQAVITGAYSLSRQAIQLGLLPRSEIRHTSESHSGQIYMPRVTTLLLLGVLLLVVLFETSSDLASAYGIAVTGTMLVTAILTFIVMWKAWKWHPVLAALAMLPFALIDIMFLSANLLKVFDGGWVPLALAGGLMTVMGTWKRGTDILMSKTRRVEVPLASLVKRLERDLPQRVSGTAVFLTSDPEFAPAALMHNLKHNKVLHEQNVILTITYTDTPRVPMSDRVTIHSISDTFFCVQMKFGYVETPNIPKALGICRKLGWKFDIMRTSFFLSRRSLKTSSRHSLRKWQDKLFITLARNASDATDFFQIPTERVVEVGTQVTV